MWKNTDNCFSKNMENSTWSSKSLECSVQNVLLLFYVIISLSSFRFKSGKPPDNFLSDFELLLQWRSTEIKGIPRLRLKKM